MRFVVLADCQPDYRKAFILPRAVREHLLIAFSAYFVTSFLVTARAYIALHKIKLKQLTATVLVCFGPGFVTAIDHISTANTIGNGL